MPKLDSLEPLMIDELRDILDAEKQVTKALPKMAKAASSEQLRAAFEQHLEQTNGQIERLNQVFEELGERPRGKKCEAMQSLIEEGQQMLEEAERGPHPGRAADRRGTEGRALRDGGLRDGAHVRQPARTFAGGRPPRADARAGEGDRREADRRSPNRSRTRGRRASGIRRRGAPARRAQAPAPPRRAEDRGGRRSTRARARSSSSRRAAAKPSPPEQ